MHAQQIISSYSGPQWQFEIHAAGSPSGRELAADPQRITTLLRFEGTVWEHFEYDDIHPAEGFTLDYYAYETDADSEIAFEWLLLVGGSLVAESHDSPIGTRACELFMSFTDEHEALIQKVTDEYSAAREKELARLAAEEADSEDEN